MPWNCDEYKIVALRTGLSPREAWCRDVYWTRHYGIDVPDKGFDGALTWNPLTRLWEESTVE